ncbi:hypothetical protein A5764_13060 [Mycobacterium sp. 852002-51057_SCH5723018]|nr:hypothetical protein A5764_13060 [Mycobacterium sp. 852002-51057_SCH5723018]
MHTIEADYLVVGAGAMGMAFTDTLVSETDARVVLVDRSHQPGGRWTTAGMAKSALSASATKLDRLMLEPRRVRRDPV